MLISATLLPLVAAHVAAPFAAAPDTPDLLSGLPANTVAAFHMPSPKALIASRSTNDWVAMAMDPEWNAIVAGLVNTFDEGGEGAAKFSEAREMLLRALANSTEIVGFLSFAPGAEEPSVGLLAEGGDDLAELLRGFVGDATEAREIAGGRTVVVGEDGRAELFHASNGIVLLVSAPSVDASAAVASDCLEALASGSRKSLFQLEGLSGERDPNAAIEMAVDFSRLWDELEKEETEPLDGIKLDVMDSLKSMGWMYGSLSLGEGEVSNVQLVLPYDQETLLGEFMGFFGEANVDMLRSAPASAVSGTVMAFDMSGFTDWTMNLIESESPETHGQIMDGLNAATEMVGIDVMGDIFHNFTGQLAILAPGRMVGGELAGLQAMTMIIGLNDADPVIDMLDMGLEMSGMAAMADTETLPVAGDEDGMEVWYMDPGIGTEVSIAAGAGQLVMSLDEVAFSDYAALLAGDGEIKTLASDKKLLAALEGASGWAVAVQSAAASADAMREAVRSIADLGGEFEGEEGAEETMADLLDATDRIANLMHRYLEGMIVTEAQAKGGRMRLEMRSR